MPRCRDEASGKSGRVAARAAKGIAAGLAAAGVVCVVCVSRVREFFISGRIAAAARLACARWPAAGRGRNRNIFF